MYLTWLDSNSWLIELAGKRILLDPWLVGPLVFGNLSWFFKAEHQTPPAIPENIDLILLSQGLPDHAHPETLKHLDHRIPVVGSASAAQVVQKLGYPQVTALQPGEQVQVGQLHIQAFPGAPIGPLTVENAYVLTDLSTQIRLYYEPHGFHSSTLQEIDSVDVVIAPLIDLRLPLVGPFINGGEKALEVVQWLQPQVVVPTTAGGEVTYQGLLNSILRAQGSVEDFRTLLTQHHCPAQVMALNPGERTEVKLAHPVTP